MIIVEVLSPSSRTRDAGAKLADHVRLPSVRHHLIVDTDERTVIHHRRDDDDERIRTFVLRGGAGALELDPLGGIRVRIETSFP